MEFKGTKGKWEKSPSSHYEEVKCVDAEYNNVMTISCFINRWIEGAFKDDSVCEESQANALLISKAPEMLEALENCLMRLTQSESLSDKGYAKHVRNLINQATTLK